MTPPDQPPDTPPARQFDPFYEYLLERGCPSHVARAGLKGLVTAWEKVVHELVFDGYRYGLRDFVADLERRDLLGGALAHVEGRLGRAVEASWKARVASADERFRGATQGASRCLLLPEAMTERGVTVEGAWWFYRLPRRHRQNFARDLAAAGIQAAPAPQDGTT